jgi:hypothetical protein
MTWPRLSFSIPLPSGRNEEKALLNPPYLALAQD